MKSPIILKNIRCPPLQNFVALKVTQLLIVCTVWFSRSEVTSHSNAAECVEKSGEQDKQRFQEWLVNTDPDLFHAAESKQSGNY